MDKIGQYLLRPVEAANALGLSRSKTYELIASGELPSIRIGRSRRVPVEALKRWVEAQQTTPRGAVYGEGNNGEATY